MKSLQEIAGSHELLSVILNNAFDAIVCYMPVRNDNEEIIDFTFVYVNDAALNTIYGRKEDYLGNSFLKLFPYAAEDGMFAAFKKTAETGIPAEEVFYYEQGDYKGWYRDSIIKYGDGLIVYFRDVTAQKTLELELVEKGIELEKLVREKEILLAETHHRVKNNLQIISSLLSLNSRKIDDPRYTEQCNMCMQRINTMALIHQRLYEESDFRSVNLKIFISEMAHSIRTLFNGNGIGVRIYLNVEDLSIDLSTSVNIGLIINELITNSYKYAFIGRKEGEIKISISRWEGKLLVKVADDGNGLPDDVDFKNVESLGFTLVNALVDQMEGTISVENNSGTIISITIPSA